MISSTPKLKFKGVETDLSNFYICIPSFVHVVQKGKAGIRFPFFAFLKGWLIMGAFSIPAGSLADRIGFSWSMVLGCLLKAAGMAMTVVAPSLEILAIARIVNGIGDAFMTTCSYIMALCSQLFLFCLTSLEVCIKMKVYVSMDPLVLYLYSKIRENTLTFL